MVTIKGNVIVVQKEATNAILGGSLGRILLFSNFIPIDSNVSFEKQIKSTFCQVNASELYSLVKMSVNLFAFLLFILFR